MAVAEGSAEKKPPLGKGDGKRNKEIEKIKEMINSSKKMKKYDHLYSKPTASSMRKAKEFNGDTLSKDYTFKPNINDLSQQIIN